MYCAAKANKLIFRLTACMVAFIYAYFGFIASLHHSDGFVPTGKTLTLHSVECALTHPEMSTDSDAPECGVCEFLANLQYPAVRVSRIEPAIPDTPSRLEPAESLHVLILNSDYSPRGPPFA